jgi:hypothetical protein
MINHLKALALCCLAFGVASPTPDSRRVQQHAFEDRFMRQRGRRQAADNYGQPTGE